LPQINLAVAKLRSHSLKLCVSQKFSNHAATSKEKNDQGPKRKPPKGAFLGTCWAFALSFVQKAKANAPSLPILWLL